MNDDEKKVIRTDVFRGPPNLRPPLAPEALLPEGRDSYDGGGNGGDGGMEQRIENLEADMREVKRDLTDIKVTLAEIKAELGHKVSYKWLAIYFLGLAALILKSEIAGWISSAPIP